MPSIWDDDELVQAVIRGVARVREGLRRRRQLRRMRRWILKNPLTPLDRLRPTARPVLIEGTAQEQPALEAPASGQAVLGWRLVVDMQTFSVNGWQRVVDLQQVQDFDLCGAGGSARIATSDALLLAHAEQQPEERFIFEDLKRPALQRALKREGLLIHDLQLARRVRCFEHLLRPDGPVLCCGIPREFIDRRSHDYRASPVRIALEAPPSAPLMVADCHLEQLRAELRQRLSLEVLERRTDWA
jgi:hypothetical protein